MKIDLKPLRELEEKGLLRSQSHPTLPLLIWNYTEMCQYSKAWDEITLMCRGLVTDLEGNIVARPFKKFFNYEEHTGSLPDGTPEIIEKVDGSLGIMFWYGDAWHIATRGSFTSEQAIYARDVLLPRISDLLVGWPKDHTHLWEVIYPANRIVCDYGGQSLLVYLGSMRTEDAEEKSFDLAPSNGCRHPARIEVAGFDLLGLKALEQPNAEGFVLRWPDGFRLKIKFEEYKRLHRLLTGCNERTIWENLKSGKGLKEIIDRVPDEFMEWVKATSKELTKKQQHFFHGSKKAYEEIKGQVRLPMSPSELPEEGLSHANLDHLRRKFDKLVSEEIEKLEDDEMKMFVYGLHRGMRQDIWRDMIWDFIYPAATKTFKIEN